jgi:uncharacterized protein RhaS with RHS repeats
MRARWYRPDWGRFLSPDPIDLLGGTNRYAFVGGSPLEFRDPFGLDGKGLRERLRFDASGGIRDTFYANVDRSLDWRRSQWDQANSFVSALIQAPFAFFEGVGDTVGNIPYRAMTFAGYAGRSFHRATEAESLGEALFHTVDGVGWFAAGAVEASAIGWVGTKTVSMVRQELRGLLSSDLAGTSGVVSEASSALPRAYSTAFETRLSASSYPGVSRARHAQEANENLLSAMESDPAFAGQMQTLGVQLERTATGLAPRTSPAGWTWHHEVEAGIMRLVPRIQHTFGSPFWDLLHPGRRGGYSIWGQ